MYEKARKGESIELSPRRISIYRIEVERSLEDRFLSEDTNASNLFLSHRFGLFLLIIHICFLQAKCDFPGDLLKGNIY